MCLNKKNNAGTIETYLDPLLYKAFFELPELRSYEKYSGPFVKFPKFRRIDEMLNDVLLELLINR